MSRRFSPREGDHSTDPLDVHRATNGAEDRVPSRPEVAEWRERLALAGFKVSFRGVGRALVEYRKVYDDDEGFLAYLLTYLDPTGETATNNVLANRVTA